MLYVSTMLFKGGFAIGTPVALHIEELCPDFPFVRYRNIIPAVPSGLVTVKAGWWGGWALELMHGFIGR